jgi:hypothetical protein
MTRCCIGLLIPVPLASSWRRSPPLHSYPSKLHRVGFLYVPAPPRLRDEEAFRHSHHEFGYVVGQHIAIEEHSASK